MQIKEDNLLDILKSSKKIFLLEPEYKRKYPPLGLAKIASFAKNNNSTIVFGRKFDKEKYDAIFLTSLFTYDSQIIIDAVKNIRDFSQEIPIVAGGICISLMPNLLKDTKNIMEFIGYSKILDMQIPIYDEINWGIDPPWNSYSFLFTSRGCPNHCSYCAVWKLESERWINPNWKNLILDNKSGVMISDNNLSSCSEEHIKNVLQFLSEKKKNVIFDNGFDCKFITKEMAQELGKIKYDRQGMRLAFDRIEEDGIFQESVKKLIEAKIPKRQIMAYVLFNFKDSPKEADYRMRECVKLGIRPYPQRYVPLTWNNRKEVYIGKLWTPKLLYAFRYFWLMAGLYTKMDFNDFIQGKAPENYRKHILSEQDIEAWNRQ